MAPIDVQPVLRDKGCGIGIARETLDAAPGRVPLQRVGDVDEIDKLTGRLIDDQGFVGLGPATVVVFDGAKNRGLARAVGKMIAVPAPHDACGQGSMIRLRNQLHGGRKTSDDHGDLPIVWRRFRHRHAEPVGRQCRESAKKQAYARWPSRSRQIKQRCPLCQSWSASNSWNGPLPIIVG